ncbi:adenylate kinase 2 [Plasmopara halstedii]|uniref:Adenylate kinase 2 n=1 Tax=Plasmopara halstedii TaxID=4781 RepID=A0A0P1AEW8_PLAHL|nr:adenylate kinase 2 [Plasmopara halstedii]CEG39125.1 adenylate kinase 2 [Plasmopara halstedii]|eukprot:XP_024575494.1 adenylate kinase 2 [Plasmopara halstedii]
MCGCSIALRHASHNHGDISLPIFKRSSMVLQLFLNGPPGSGKTTLAKLLCQEFNLELVATGDLLRENIKMQTAAGRKAERCIAGNKLIPDRVVLDMVEAKITSCLAQGRMGWVLDSFPRTADQAKLLTEKPQLRPAIVILLDLPRPECIARITGRRFDPVTGAVYHSPDSMPRDPIIRSRLTRRRDDTEERILPRFEAYKAFGETTNEMLVSCQSILHRIDAFKPSAAILEEISVLLHSLAKRPQQKYSVSNNTHHESNNQTQNMEKAVLKASVRLSPETILEMPDESDDDDGIQTYRYDWDDSNSPINGNQRKSSIEQLEPEDNERDVVQALDNKLSSSFMAALPLPVLPSKPGSLIDDNSLPPPPGPKLRPLPTPKGRLKSFLKPSEVIESSVQIIEGNDILTARSSTSGIAQSSMNTMTLETAAASIDLSTFKELLLDGFEAVKHGRRGRPHPRLIYTDLGFKRVFWQKAMNPADRVGKGKHARMEQSIVLSDVIQITRGMKTAVLKRSGNVARYECYVSLVTPRRTLDLELPNLQLADFLQRGFEQLLHH